MGSHPHEIKTYMAMDRAIEARVPLIMLNDSGGVRPQEQFVTFTYSTQIFRRHTAFSGIIPQISVIMGPVAGGPGDGPALTDFIFMVRERVPCSSEGLLSSSPYVLRM